MRTCKNCEIRKRYAKCFKEVGYLLTIDPVKHGKWITKDGGKTTVCSSCGDIWGRTDFVLKYLHYCPNCGAKMEGAKNDCSD